MSNHRFKESMEGDYMGAAANIAAKLQNVPRQRSNDVIQISVSTAIYVFHTCCSTTNSLTKIVKNLPEILKSWKM